MAENKQDSYEECVLQNDEGFKIRFSGKLFSETSYYDDDAGTLTRFKLFVTDDGRQVYSIVSGSQTVKQRRCYVVRFEDDICHISNGEQEISLHTDMLLTVVFGLCGITNAEAGSLRAFIEDARRLANA